MRRGGEATGWGVVGGWLGGWGGLGCCGVGGWGGGGVGGEEVPTQSPGTPSNLLPSKTLYQPLVVWETKKGWLFWAGRENLCKNLNVEPLLFSVSARTWAAAKETPTQPQANEDGIRVLRRGEGIEPRPSIENECRTRSLELSLVPV